MKADHKVTKVSLSGIPAVALFERDRGMNVTVLYVMVRTDYDETEEEAIRRAKRIADHLTSALALRKSGSTNHIEENQSHGITSKS
jgi:3-polyprenyl-4-hydroxybenzoate decarboxylase